MTAERMRRLRERRKAAGLKPVVAWVPNKPHQAADSDLKVRTAFNPLRTVEPPRRMPSHGRKRTFGRNGIKVEHGPMQNLCACLRARVCGGESPPLPRFAFRVWPVHRTRATCAEAFFYRVSGSDIPR